MSKHVCGLSPALVYSEHFTPAEKLQYHLEVLDLESQKRNTYPEDKFWRKRATLGQAMLKLL
jgi:hypothetical protein